MENKKEGKVNINLDANKTPILFTDMTHMNVNDDGVTIDICQRMGNTNQMNVIARVGMSREYAEKFVKKLSEALALTSRNKNPEVKN